MDIASKFCYFRRYAEIVSKNIFPVELYLVFFCVIYINLLRPLPPSFMTKNPGNNILELCNILVQVRFAASKISSIANLVNKLSHELPINLRQDLRKSGNIRRISNLGWGIAQCPVSFPGVELGQQQSKSTQKHILKFFSWSRFTGFLYFVPNILSRIESKQHAGEKANLYILVIKRSSY